MKLTLIDGEEIEVNLYEIVYISGVDQGNHTAIRGRKVFLDHKSAKIVRDDIRRRCDEFEKAQELREIIWAS